MSPAPALAMSPKPKVSFSIDSIMGGGAGPSMPPRPGLTPGHMTPSKHPPMMSHLRSPGMPLQPTPTRPRPAVSPPRSPPPREAPPAAPYSPYSVFPGVHPLLGQDARLLDPRLAQLAGLADPRLAGAGSPYHNLLLVKVYVIIVTFETFPHSFNLLDHIPWPMETS